MRHRHLKNVATLEYKASNCTGCKRCVEVCPRGVFGMVGRKARIFDKNDCMECGACALNCPAKAIAVSAGVGCATAIILGWLKKKEPSCDCISKKCC